MSEHKMECHVCGLEHEFKHPITYTMALNALVKSWGRLTPIPLQYCSRCGQKPLKQIVKELIERHGK